ncbi:HNH endonuclease signature motif containing protein [Corynebacterium liangguodongii]|uniref:HNH endonuclease n=1 Tax=Corynebacterium liangguodongii TaxID=2079535 RepID=A0A2S0WBF1_9CORY|nr:HNH endonuclease signature motif containing protein [Corynebacterium liangguodongii]AWB83084.1 HNH endonuclease [Corynebacterium liangguodongii]PWB99315.1 HNH endonuclease [Corynebacterium liangguodongii]
MTTQLAHLVDDIANATHALSEAFSTPESLTFHAVRGEMERLYAALEKFGFIDASFAYLAERDGAGSVVGAHHAIQYFVDVLGFSRAEAMDRIMRGKRLFGEPEVPPQPDEPAEDPEAQARREQEEERRKAEARKARAEARKEAARVNAEKQKIIAQCLRDLNEHSNPGFDALHSLALKEATSRTPEDLRAWLRDQVARANRAGRDYDDKKDPLAAWKKRGVTFGHPDSDGLARMVVTGPKAELSLFKALIQPGYAPGTNTGVDPSADTRTRAQRGFDQLMAIARAYDAEKAKRSHGVCSIVLSLTLEDLLGSEAGEAFPTNTGTDLSALDILRLGLGKTDFILQLDDVTGLPLSLGATRLASVHQKLALLAAQGVCAWAGCDKAAMELEAHHVLAWKDGGRTDIDNLVGLCRQHHRCNNDARDGAGNKGFVDINPDTGRVEHHPADGSPPRTNETHGYHTSAGAKIRRRAKRNRRRGPTQAVLFPP